MGQLWSRSQIILFRAIYFVTLLFFSFAPGSAMPDDDKLSVASVVDGDTLELSTGREVRLTGIQAPKLPLGRPNFKTWPLADTAKRDLESLALGQAVTLEFDGAREDRYGRFLAHVLTGDGVWLQGAMLERGLARVYTFQDNRARADEMLALERQARAQGIGIWADRFYRIRSPDAAALKKEVGTYQIVEGRVRNAARIRGRTFLNFGRDYRTDFTVTVAPRDLEPFKAAGLDLMRLKDRRIRVRGWVRSFNGPSIDVDHPEQIEVLKP